jgi:hypothetical protein
MQPRAQHCVPIKLDLRTPARKVSMSASTSTARCNDMGRTRAFVFQKPAAFQAENVTGEQIGQSVGYFATQGHRFKAGSGRVCEDVPFVASASAANAVCGVLDGHGGALCAQAVARLLTSTLKEDTCEASCLGAPPIAQSGS